MVHQRRILNGCTARGDHTRPLTRQRQTRNPKKHSAPAEKAGALLYIKEQLDAID
jgi:hypothetical protein